MQSLPENCTEEQALAIIAEDYAAEEARLLAEYEPYEPSPEDRGWFAPQDMADEIESWEEYAEWAEQVDAIYRGLEFAGGLTDYDMAVCGAIG